jgi:hypothetical protein
MTFNYYAQGNPFKLSGAVKAARAIDSSGNPYDPDKVTLENAVNELDTEKVKDPVKFFKTRNLLNGFYIHILSPDRGIIYYAPVVLFGIWGYFISKKRYEFIPKTILATVGIIVLLYSMWGDPWGGWAFGSRYLIPVYALLSIFIGFWLDKYSGRLLFVLLFLIAAFVSVRVNTIGALTSISNPPKVQVLQLESLSGREEKYTVARNVDQINANSSRSYIYRTFLQSKLGLWQYFWIVFSAVYLLIFANTALLAKSDVYINLKRLKKKWLK